MTKFILIGLGDIEMLYNGRDLKALMYVLVSIGSCLFGRLLLIRYLKLRSYDRYKSS